ncbi:glycoside hydrolase family 32 protein [Paenibacillus beijingensis]|uniref:Sucrose-6-phosphate hydrolase n=1 Tax=Paenibacillus beijingensis TaxID=1126833 RepID=A0A0D5NF53_9BACL|nr:glycoside hydrolase family 32 protein [Paenibacillus beijingensis]AJY73871.1 hypothetical protein VN24_03655 [Paenibacillus beijingensis]
MNQLEHRERIQQASETVAAQAKEAAKEQYRLHYHFMPPANWMNDPNGLIHYKGEYHLFYQHYPYADQWGPMYWGHAKSKDLVRWQHLPVALAPSEDYDRGEQNGHGCWSGSAVEHDGKLVLFYTGHVDGRDPVEVQCMAVSEDGVTFEKHAGNPVVAGPPESGLFGFRDPKVWKHGDWWYMVVGSGKDGKGRALLYRARELTDWQYVGVAAESDGTQGDMWECPDLFPLGGKHVLIISPMNMPGTKNLVMVGEMDYESGVFTPETCEKLDEGFDFYAAQTLEDADGRRIVIGWMDMWGSKMIAARRGWYGAMTIPRQLVLTPEGSVASVPVPELETLREDGRSYENVVLESGKAFLPDLPGGSSLEVIAEFDLTGDRPERIELKWITSEDEAEETVIRYDANAHTLSVDRDRSGAGDTGVCTASVAGIDAGRLKLQLFIDQSSIELFAGDGRKVLSNRIYPGGAEARLQISADGGSAQLQSLQIWKLSGMLP